MSYEVTKSRVLQWIGIIVFLSAMGGAYWYFSVRASTVNAPQNDALTSGLVGLWSFNGDDISGTTAYDRSGGGRNGTLTNSPAITEGKLGQALTFNGTSQYVSVPYAGIDFERTDAFTLSAWAKWEDFAPTGGAQGIMGRLTGGISRGTSVIRCKNAIGGICNAGSIGLGLWGGVSGAHLLVSTPTNSTVPNVWTHVVVTYDGSSSASGVKIYKDGVSQTLTTHDNDLATTIKPNINWRIGDDATSDYAKGPIDEVRMYNRALTATEIQSLYALGQSDKTNSAISQPQGTGRLDSGLAGYWKLDENTGSSSTADASTNGNNGSIHCFVALCTKPAWITGQIGSALDFDGTDDDVTISDADVLDVSDGSNFTLSGWFNRDTFTTDDTIFAKSNGQTAADTGYNVYIDDATDKLTFVANDGTDQYKLESASTFVAIGWHHYSVVWNDGGAGQTKLYINGKAEAATATGTFASVNSLANAVNLLLGAESDYGSPFDGKIDEARVYNRALSAEEVADLYRLNTPTGVDTSLKGYWSFNGKDLAGTTAYDRSGGGKNGTLTGSPTIAEGKIGQALSFNGSSQYVTADGLAGASGPIATGDVTFSAWVNLSASHDASASSWKIIMETSDASSTNDILLFFNTIGALGADGALCLYVNSSPGYSACTTQVSWSSGIWQHVAGTYSGVNGAKVYVNGVQVGSNGTTGRGSTKATKFTIGAHYPGGSAGYFPGTIDEARVYNRVLTAAEIQSLYDTGQSDKVNSSVSQPQGTGRLDSGLAGYWKLDENTGTSAGDSSTNGYTGTLTNGPTWGTGQIGSGVVFDGSNDYVAANGFAGATSPIGAGDVTFSAWAKLSTAHDSAGTNKHILSFNDSPSSNDVILLFNTNGAVGTDGGLCFLVYNAAYNASCTTQNSWSSGTWMHVVGTYSSASGSVLYLNGVRVANNSSTGRGTTKTSVFTIGANFPGGGSAFFPGDIDETRVYNRALSVDEVSQLYRLTTPSGTDTSLKGYWSFNGKDLAGTTAYDRSGGGRNGTLTNSPAVAEGKIGQALSFNGTSQYVQLNNSITDLWSTNAARSISFWTYVPNDWDSTSYITPVVFSFKAGASNFVLYYGRSAFGSSGLGINFGYGHGIFLAKTASDSKPLIKGRWAHVVLTYDGTSYNTLAKYRLYVDGVSQSLAAGNNYITSAVNQIGYDSSGAGVYFYGKIDEMRVYNRVLTINEVKALYNQAR